MFAQFVPISYFCIQHPNAKITMKRLFQYICLLSTLLCNAACLKSEAVEPDGPLGNPSSSLAIATDPVRILAIGNSFSANAVDQNLNELAAADGRVCEIGNLVIGGCSLERHVSNIRSDAKEYSYRTRSGLGKQTIRTGVSIREALQEQDWDVISVQQVSHLAGMFNTYSPWLPELLAYIMQYRPNAKIVFHQTWAYAQDADHSGFAYYNRDQQAMYEAIITAVRRAAGVYEFEYVIPSGTAIQNLRSILGDAVYTDGFHLNALGCYTAACTWYEAIFGGNVSDNSYERADLDAEQQRQARRAAHAAVANPWEVTDLRK